VFTLLRRVQLLFPNIFSASITTQVAATAVVVEEWLNQQIHQSPRRVLLTPREATANTLRIQRKNKCSTVTPTQVARCTHNQDPTGQATAVILNMVCQVMLLLVLKPRPLLLQQERVPAKFTPSSPFLGHNNTSDLEDDTKKLSACTNVDGMDAKRLMEH